MSSGRKRATERHYSAEDQALDQISKEAEEKIQARRLARAEAREIRLREIERQQKEEEEKQKGSQLSSDVKSLSGYSGSRRGSDDSTGSDMSGSSRDPKDQVRLVKNQLRDLEEKYKAAMVTNAQLDNIKTSHVFQLELLKEQIVEQEEAMIEVQREYKDKCRDFELLKRDFDALKLESEGLRQQIDMKDKLIKESGLVIATSDDGNFSLSRCSDLFDVPVTEMSSAIISEEAADLLKRAGEGTLGKTDLNPKNDTSNVKQNEDSHLADADKNIEKIDVTKVDDFSSSVTDVDHSPVSAVSEALIDFQSDKEIIDVVDNANVSENDPSTCIDSVAVDNIDSNVASRDVPVVQVSDRKETTDSFDDESDENEVFYESKSEFSPNEVKHEPDNDVVCVMPSLDNVVDMPDRIVEKDSDVISKIDAEGKDEFIIQQSDDACEEKTVGENVSVNDNVSDVKLENETDLCMVREKEMCQEVKDEVKVVTEDEVNLIVQESINEDSKSENETENVILNETGATSESLENIHDKSGVTFWIEESDGDVPESLVDANSNAMNDTKSVGDLVSRQVSFPSVSCISLESDVTYHSESDDEVNVGESVECQKVSNPEQITDDAFIDENSNGIGFPKSRSAIPLCSSISSESDLEDDCGIIKTGKDEVKRLDDIHIDKGLVIRDISGFDNEFDREISHGHSDEVFMSSTLDEIRADISTNVFARDYVKGVIQKSLDIYNSDIDEDKITVKKQSITAENIEISVCKRHYSEELLDSASSVFTQNLTSGSVEILSPLLDVPSEEPDNQVFFSCKVETDLDVVKNATDSDNPAPARPGRSSISGFAVCYTGIEGLSDVESDSDGDNVSNPPVVESKSHDICPDFTIMPMSISNKPDSSENLKSAVEDSAMSTAMSTNEDNAPGSDEDNSLPEDKADKKEDSEANVKSSDVDECEPDQDDDDRLEPNALQDSHEFDGELEQGVSTEVTSHTKEDENINMDQPVCNSESTETELQGNTKENIPISETPDTTEITELDTKTEEGIIDKDEANETTRPSDNMNNDVEKSSPDQVDESKEVNGASESEKNEAAVDGKDVDENAYNDTDSSITKDAIDMNVGNVSQGAHGGQSDDDDDEEGSGLSLSEDDILADLEKCESTINAKDTKEEPDEISKLVENDSDKTPALNEDDNIWVKQETSESPKEDERKQEKTGEASKGSGKRRSGEVSPPDDDGQDLETVLNRKQSKKKSKKKHSKEKEEYDKLKKIIAEKKQLQEEINTLTNQISEERSKRSENNAQKSNSSIANGPELQLYEIQREASKQIHEYKLKLQKAEQEITNLDGTVNRLETQVKRFKYDAEEAERLEEELKSDRRRLQRELRECQNQIEELQNQNKHLTKRLEKIRQTRSALGVST